MARGRRELGRRLNNLALSQKINIIFGLFFAVSGSQMFIDYGLSAGPGDTDAPYYAVVFVTLAVLMLLVARRDSVVIRYVQVGALVLLSFFMIWGNSDSSDLAHYILLSVALAGAYKMNLFGGSTRRFLFVTVFLAALLATISGTIYGFSLATRVNVLAFVLAYMALLYVIFEEETISLRVQRDVLTRKAEELVPFAELGENVAGLVHDFKGDVAGIAALASVERLAENDATAAKLDKFAGRLNRRIEAVMYVASGRDHVAIEEVDLAEFFRCVTYYFVEINANLKHSVEITLDAPEVLPIRSRRSVLLALFENVIKNAVEASEGHAVRTVSIQVRAEVGSTAASVTVANSGRELPFDTGDGVDVRKSSYFQRGRSTKTKGTGLGMVNIIRALEILGATMTMRNTGNGVESTIVIPTISPDQ